MRLKILLLATALFFSMQIIAQKSNVEQNVLTIRKEFERINSSKLSTKSIVWNSKCGVINALLTFYYEDGAIVKIVDKGDGDDDKTADKWNFEYYYSKGKIIFIYETSSYHDNESNKKMNSEIRKYYAEDMLIRKIEDKVITDNINQPVTAEDLEYKIYKIKNKSDIAKVFECKN